MPARWLHCTPVSECRWTAGGMLEERRRKISTPQRPQWQRRRSWTDGSEINGSVIHP